MSDLRIALVAEGPTDLVIIEAALKAILKKPMIVTLLQPENPPSAFGAGWCGVLKWCLEFKKRGYAGFEQDPTLEGFDFLILHLDADVASASYTNCSLIPEGNWGTLPCEKPCPPAVDSVNDLKAAITSWTGLGILGDIKLCIPSKSIDTWLAAAVFYGDSKLMNNIECENMASKLEQLPKNLRIKKSQRVYQNYAEKIAENWDQVRQLCTQADAFQQEMQ
jgi:hypothetical protein